MIYISGGKYKKRKIEINNSNHALKVVAVLEECSTKMQR